MVTALLSVSFSRFFPGISDRGKAYTDVLAGTLVLLNSFVMLVELEIEGCGSSMVSRENHLTHS